MQARQTARFFRYHRKPCARCGAAGILPLAPSLRPLRLVELRGGQVRLGRALVVSVAVFRRTRYLCGQLQSLDAWQRGQRHILDVARLPMRSSAVSRGGSSASQPLICCQSSGASRRSGDRWLLALSIGVELVASWKCAYGRGSRLATWRSSSS